jgi:hypothetical protein
MSHVTEPDPLDRSRPLWGRDLRHAALVILDERGTVSVGELLATLTSAGFEVAGVCPRKVLSDALRHEVHRGRARRVGWGRYAVGRLPPTTARRVRRRWHRAAG